MSALILGDGAKESIKMLMGYAQSHVLSLPMMEKTLKGEQAPVGDNPDYVIYLRRISDRVLN